MGHNTPDGLDLVDRMTADQLVQLFDAWGHVLDQANKTEPTKLAAGLLKVCDLTAFGLEGGTCSLENGRTMAREMILGARTLVLTLPWEGEEPQA